MQAFSASASVETGLLMMGLLSFVRRISGQSELLRSFGIMVSLQFQIKLHFVAFWVAPNGY